MDDKLEFNSDLVDDLAKGRTALFLGSGVSSSAMTKSGKRMKGWDAFLREQISEISKTEDKEIAQDLLNKKDYLLACEITKECLGVEKWEEAVTAEFSQAGTTSELHKAILSLNQRITITTNFDKYLESSITAENSGTHLPTIYNGLRPDIFKVLRDENKYLIKLHGTVDNPESLIFAKSDYNDKAYGNWVYRDFIETLLLTHTLVFVGFSMDDPAITHLIEMYANKYNKCRPHYIFTSGPVQEKIKAMSKKFRKLYIIDYSPDNNHEELVKLIESLASQTNTRRKSLLAESISR